MAAYQNIENMTKTFAFLEKRNLRPPQVSAEDVVEGRERAILSLLWTLYRNSIKGSILKWAQSVTGAPVGLLFLVLRRPWLWL